MRTTNIFGAFLVGIAMVQGVPLRRDMSSSLSHDRASERPYDLDSVSLSTTAIDLEKDQGDGSNIILDTRAKSSSKSKPAKSKSPGRSSASKSPGKSSASKSPGKSSGSKLPGKSSGSKSPGKSSGSKSPGRLTGSKSPGQSTGSQSSGKSTGSQSSKSKSSKSKPSKSTADKDGNSSSTAQKNDNGDIEEQDALNSSTENMVGSSEEDTEQDIQDAPEDDAEEDISAVSDQDTEEDPQDLSQDDTEGLNDEDFDDSGIQSSGGDSDEMIPEQEISVTNNTSSNFTLKLARTVKDNRKYQRPTFLMLRDVKEQEEQRNKYSGDAETDTAVDNGASHEANREDGKEQSVGDFQEKRAINLAGLFKSIIQKLGNKDIEEVASSVSQDSVEEDDSVGEDGKTVASIEMATRRSDVS